MKRILKIISAIATLYIGICLLAYFFQETLIFHPNPLPENYTYSFPEKFQEIDIKTADGNTINSLLFKRDSSKGLIFFLHGNADNLTKWGNFAPVYLENGYDFFVFDYRGYGKSSGEIISEEQFYSDAQTVYNKLKEFYPEEKIIIVGFSVGSGTAAMLAANNHPKQLILHAPYYSIEDMMHHRFPFLPGFLLKYPFRTYEHLEKTKCPVTIFHGTNDLTIYYGSSLKLQKHFKKEDRLITLEGIGHNGIEKHPEYVAYLKSIR